MKSPDLEPVLRNVVMPEYDERLDAHDDKFKMIRWQIGILAFALLVFAASVMIAFERRDGTPAKVEVRLPTCAALEGTAWEGAVSCIGDGDEIVTPED